MSKRDVACVRATQNTMLSAQDVVSNRGRETERREPMGISAEQHVDQSIAKADQEGAEESEEASFDAHSQTNDQIPADRLFR